MLQRFIFASDLHGDQQDKEAVRALLKATESFKPHFAQKLGPTQITFSFSGITHFPSISSTCVDQQFPVFSFHNPITKP